MKSERSAKLKVFLAEDSVPVRRRISLSLGRIDGVCVVGEAEDVSAALEGIAASCPDLVIADLRLAQGNGLELIEAVTAANQPVVTMMLTNHAGPAFREASLAAGAQYFFDKTAEFEEARSAVEAIARTHRTRAVA
ncbi:response regulator [Paraburkholderia kururiensis]|uniref:response regulator n=1 Tax=Paraburkholderia kururiensis TaxID=984307 RepID=UPI0005AB6B6C|nr:response regulator transcription factor [Paraburkholderia kururiensis]